MDGRTTLRQPSQPLVLIVEGHADTRSLYLLGLSQNGFDVVAVRDCAEVCSRALEIRPDIIVTDLPMPNGDGWQFLHDLRQNARTRHIPVVALSGYVQQSLRERAERDGFAAFIPKPCLPEKLAQGLRQVLSEPVRAPAQR